MSGRKQPDWISLDELTDDQQAILLSNATNWLVTKAADLPTARDENSWRIEVEEVAALGRIISGLRLGAILGGDEVVRKLAARTVSETDHLDEVTEEYRRELDEHEAWVALLARVDAAAGGER